jgi:hypothetical protein
LLDGFSPAILTNDIETAPNPIIYA